MVAFDQNKNAKMFWVFFFFSFDRPDDIDGGLRQLAKKTFFDYSIWQHPFDSKEEAMSTNWESHELCLKQKWNLGPIWGQHKIIWTLYI